jgi:mannose-6-phosphate isomerase-like protein (cupin superfamily)
MSRPSIELRAPIEVGKRDWGREILIAHTDAYIGKVLLMKAGTAGGLQYHKTKIETFFLDEGQAFVDYDANGTLTTISMSPGMIVHVPAGAPHRVRAVSDCKFFEVSTPVFNDRVRVEADYGEPEGGGLPTT